IIPGQRRMVASLSAGQALDPMPGLVGKQRSVHNTYFTLPVVFAMLSNHYGFITQHSQKWLLLLLIMLAGALIRLFFVKRHAYKLGRQPHPWPYLAASIGILISMVVLAAPTAPSTSGAHVSGRLSDVQSVMQNHCLQCHGAAVQLKNVRLDSTEELKRHAAAIYQQVVVQKAMPMSNLTQMSDQERAIIAVWFKSGAPTQ
ncbi:MAG: urate hydroxylase PuuD, partial [Orrella sp.]